MVFLLKTTGLWNITLLSVNYHRCSSHIVDRYLYMWNNIVLFNAKTYKHFIFSYHFLRQTHYPSIAMVEILLFQCEKHPCIFFGTEEPSKCQECRIRWNCVSKKCLTAWLMIFSRYIGKFCLRIQNVQKKLLILIIYPFSPGSSWYIFISSTLPFYRWAFEQK